MSKNRSGALEGVKVTVENVAEDSQHGENDPAKMEDKPGNSEKVIIANLASETVITSNNGPVTEESDPRPAIDLAQGQGKNMDKTSKPDPSIIINDNEMFEYEKESEGEESCFKIDKVYSVASEDLETRKSSDEKQEKKTLKIRLIKESTETGESSESKDDKTVKGESKKMKEDKQIKPKTARPAIAKVPTLTAGVGGVRVLGGGIRGTNMPLIVSMGAGNPGIPLLPAGLPPGRYVILPGTSTSSKTSGCATLTTVSANLNPRLATNIATSATRNLVAAQKVLTPPPNTAPQPSQGMKMYTRERGRRKSYTAGEKLAMIEAVEGGQRKSAVADRFGVAPSTLACILAQKHKIRAEQDNLARRRVRQAKYPLREDLSGKIPTVGTSTLRFSPTTDIPFTHFLAPLSAPTPTLLDTQPEEIIAVPDLVERLSGGTCGSSEGKTEGSGEAEDEDTGLGVSLMDTEQSMDEDYLHDPQDIKSNVFQQSAELVSNNVGEETTAQDASGHAPSPTPSNQGLVGPYLLKKETHCSTVLDQLLRDDTYTDVTLTAEGQSLRAHRIVLCLASPYFRQVLSRELNVQSVVLLRDIKFAELRNIINFIYTGEATVDASELESFMRTAEMLEISSLCEGQKCISGRGLHTQGNFSSGFSIADFERLLGSKRSRKDSSPTPCKTRRVSGEGQSSRCSSAEPAATSIPLSLIKEEPGCETDSMLQSKSAQVVKENELLDVVERNEGGGESGGSRRESLESVGGFAAIAGVQKTLPNADDVSEDVFSSTAELSPNSQLAEAARQNAVTSVPDTMSIPGRCPYCPHLPQKYEGVAMMRHLLVAHPCKPAFPCDSCWRVFVKRVYFKAHQQKCSPPIS
ncbi:hypothetical protein OTU49_011987 [Cherax quadricarinatus]|uniref:BTB domain-containing protein n=1 Tax=Cherax quadricarinatus TaxID=27406 RepID=A0AAW0W1D1_CHEQU